MSDLEFEKNMQQKLDELDLRPSDAVWTAVEKEIRRDKRRRVLLWWWPFLCLSLAAGGYFTWHGLSPKKPSMAHVSVNDVKKSSAAQEPHQDKEKETTPAGTQDQFSQVKKGKKEGSDESNVGVQPQAQHANGTSQADKLSSNSHGINGQAPTKAALSTNKKKLTDPGTARQVAPPTNQNELTDSRAITQVVPLADKRKLVHPGTTREFASPTNKSALADSRPPIDKNELTDSKAGKQDTPPAKNNELTDSKATAQAASPTNKNEQVDSIATAQALSTSKNELNDSTTIAQLTPANKGKSIDSPSIAQLTPPAPKKTPSKKLRWQWGVVGFAGGGQTASANGINLKSAAPVDITNNYYAQAAPAAIGPGINSKPSEVKPALAYTAGIFGRLITGKRFAFTAALQYARYSTSITVGQKTYTPLYNSLTNTRVDGYYRSSSANPHKYRNVYQFVELPLSMEWRLNRSKSLPLYWNVGPSLSYLFKTDALHYDSKNGVYYSDNDLFNRWQFGLATGLEVGLFNRGRIPLRVGPAFTYGLTSLVHGVPEKQRMLSLGLKLEVLLKK